MQVETTMRYHYTHIMVVSMKEPGVNMNIKYVEHSHTVRSIQYLALSIKAKGEQVL